MSTDETLRPGQIDSATNTLIVSLETASASNLGDRQTQGDVKKL